MVILLSQIYLFMDIYKRKLFISFQKYYNVVAM